MRRIVSMLAMSVVGWLGLGFGATASAQRVTPEVRGTWLTTTANTALSSPDKTAETMKRLRAIGLNVVYVECWKNGFTEYPSPTMERLIGVPMRINNTPPELQRDLLGEAVIEAHRNELLAIAWLEYGFMAAFKDSEHEFRKFAREKGWLSLARDGAEVGKINSFVWLNPFHPEVQQFLIDITLDAVRRYDLDGIQLDDRIALPVDLGYDEYTRKLYRAETGREVPDDFRDPEWMKWRADKISEYSLRYVTEIRQANPDLILSVSPAPFPWSYENYLCDWMKWTQWCYCGGKRWDEYIPQTYRMDGPRTIASIDEQVAQIGENKHELIAGVRIVGDGPDITWSDLKMVLDHCRELKIGGVCFWFSRGVLDLYEKELTAYYDVANLGHARHPARTRDWRARPIVATKTDGVFRANVTQGNRYRVIVKRNGQWSESTSLDLKPGVHAFVEEADELELLVDRRR